MKRTFFLTFPFTILAILGVLITGMALSFVLPPPFRYTNVLFVFLLLSLLFRESGRVVWMAFLSHFFLELFVTTPFGIVLSAATLSILLSYWALLYIFTNRSWYTALTLSIFSLTVYRGLSLVFLVIYGSVGETSYDVSARYLSHVGWEILMTTCAVTLCYTAAIYGRKKLSRHA